MTLRSEKQIYHIIKGCDKGTGEQAHEEIKKVRSGGLECRSSVPVELVKHLATMWETLVQSLGWEDLLEKKMATHSSIFAWKIPWIEESGGLLSMGSQRVRHN